MFQTRNPTSESSFSRATLAEHFDGIRWTAVTTPNTADEDSLAGVAAVTSSNVAAVGDVVDHSGAIPVDRTLAEQFNGASWATQPSANVGTTDNLLTGATRIPGSGGVWAVGFHLTATGPDQTLIERAG